MTYIDAKRIRDLISEEQVLDQNKVEQIITTFGFENWRSIHKSLLRICKTKQIREKFSVFIPTLFQILADVANPDGTLINFEHFSANHTDQLSLFDYLSKNPRALELLSVLFAGSQFLTDILLRNPNKFERIIDKKVMVRLKSRPEIYSQANELVSSAKSVAEKLNSLRKFQKWELLRIGSADLFGFINIQSVTTQLSNLARVCIRICLEISAEQIGLPKNKDFSVLALGKLGGRELNYSSDIDLLFISKQRDEKFPKLAKRLIEALSKSTAEGFLYRVDMRLRPWGNIGALVPTLEENIAYLKTQAKIWEKQALYKARAVAGDELLAIEFLELTRPIIFEIAREDLLKEIKVMKGKIETNLKQKKNKGWGEVKTGKGSIRDVEFLTQYYQLNHGKGHPEIQSRNTLDGLARLTATKILTADDYRTLSEGYIFLRSVEHHLQIMQYQQTHQMPRDKRELTFLARRLSFQGTNVNQQLLDRYQEHSRAIRTVYDAHINTSDKSRIQTKLVTSTEQPLPPSDADYLVSFNPQERERHSELFKKLSQDKLISVETTRLSEQKWRVTVVGHDYPGGLSIICGLFFEYGINILEGSIFTYTPKESQEKNTRTRRGRKNRRYIDREVRKSFKKKIVDIFTVSVINEDKSLWEKYENELNKLATLLREKKRDLVQGELARRTALVIEKYTPEANAMLPVEIAIDNNSSEKYTVLRIDAPDTIGFLFEFSNALSLLGVNIARVFVNSMGNRVHDTLFLTDMNNKKIISPEKQHQLRTAIVLVKHFTNLLPLSPNPESAILHFREFILNLFTEEEWRDSLSSLEKPEVLDALAKLLGVSDFLWNDFLRMQHKNLFPIIKDLQVLQYPKNKTELEKELLEKLADTENYDMKKNILNQFKDREMFRIDMRYIQQKTKNFEDFSKELSDLAEVVVATAAGLCQKNLNLKFGAPRLVDNSECKFSICALGKFGGRDLGFASDIELMFIYEDIGHTNGIQSITNEQYFQKLIKEFLKTIISKRDGIFEIDLRLRPYGKHGNLGVCIPAFREYYAPGGPAWDYEKQALVKMRPITGDHNFNKFILGIRDEGLFKSPSLDVPTMRAMREKQIRQLVTGGTINAKFSAGALVDLEYLVQHLQIQHAWGKPTLRCSNTTDAITALHKAQLLSKKDCTLLNKAHLFLRKLIEALRMVRGNAKELTVPNPDSKEFSFLAKSMDYSNDISKLQTELNEHTSKIIELNKRLLA